MWVWLPNSPPISTPPMVWSVLEYGRKQGLTIAVPLVPGILNQSRLQDAYNKMSEARCQVTSLPTSKSFRETTLFQRFPVWPNMFQLDQTTCEFRKDEAFGLFAGISPKINRQKRDFFFGGISTNVRRSPPKKKWENPQETTRLLSLAIL